MSHYICTGECKGKSDTPGVCKDKTCSKYNQPLTPCDCADMKHAVAMETMDEGEQISG